VCLGVATPASALSCLPADAVRSYKEAAASEEAYRVIFGTISLLARPNAPLRQSVALPGVVTGAILGAGGFAGELSFPVTVQVNCFGPWCGAVPEDGAALVLVQETPEGLVLVSEPCPQWYFASPEADLADKVEACHVTGECVETPF
jgi:hypothetical protein